MNKKGQTATEYLIILAVVIIIALIVVGVLGGIPSIGGGASQSAQSSYWKTNGAIGVDAIAVSANAATNDSIVIRNLLPYPIVVTSISLGPSTTNQTVISTSPTTLSAGAAVVYSNTSIPDGVLAKFSSPTCAAGSSFAFRAIFNYTEVPTGLTQTFTGAGNVLTGTCSN